MNLLYHLGIACLITQKSTTSHFLPSVTLFHLILLHSLAMSSNDTDTKIVRFNVGGTPYQAARETIERYPGTMLARMISETWLQDPKQELFVDSDGPRFQYVLDYMRHQKVHLPFTMAKASVRQDLDYFGFEDVPEDAIDRECAKFQAAEQVALCRIHHNQELNRLRTALSDLQVVIDS